MGWILLALTSLFLELTSVAAAAVAGAALAFSAGTRLARQASRSFGLTDGMLFGAVGGALGGIAGAAGWRLIQSASAFTGGLSESLINALETGLFVGLVLGTAGGVHAIWRQVAAERAFERRRAGDLTLR
jgi:hypothetical protein